MFNQDTRLFVALFSLLLVNATSYAVPQQTRQRFIKFMVPKIEQADDSVMQTRGELEALHVSWEEGKKLPYDDVVWVEKLAKIYRVKPAEFISETTWNELLHKVDGLPVSMVLAQAINESAWGTSYFAHKANNYFGIWCSSPGCGVVPRKRSRGATHEVRKFTTASASVAGYLLNINRKRSYRELRAMRADLRAQDRELDSNVLVDGLVHYSQLGPRYIKIVRAIINHYQLWQYDQ